MAGWGTEQATARITSVAKRAAKPNVQLARSADAGRDRDGTGSLASVAPARPMDGWTPDACLLSRVPPSWPRPRFLPFPPCGSGSRPLSDRRSLQRGSTNWLAGYSTVLYCTKVHAAYVSFSSPRKEPTVLCSAVCSVCSLLSAVLSSAALRQAYTVLRAGHRKTLQYALCFFFFF